MSKDQRKLKKRKVREEQKRQNLIRLRKKRQEDKRLQRKLYKEDKKVQTEENKSLQELRQQQMLREKITLAEESYERVKDQLTDEQRNQILKNIAILQEYLQEYEVAEAERQKVHQRLEAQGIVDFKDKMNAIAKEAQETYGEGCLEE